MDFGEIIIRAGADFLKRPRASPYFLQIIAFCFSKNQRKRAKIFALALRDFVDGLIHFQKNDFWYRVRGSQKSFF